MVSNQEAKRGRRTHRKSRLGCQPCKQRKIKCDESRPVCLNCTRREIGCSFPASDVDKGLGERALKTLRFVPFTQGDGGNYKHPQVHCESVGASKTSSSSPQVSIELMAMSHRIASLEETIHLQKISQEEPPGLTYADMALLHHYFHLPDKYFGDEELFEAAFQHPHLLHLILGISALHWARQASDRRAEFVAQSDRHYIIGMRGATKLLSAMNEDAMQLVYISAILIAIYNLALGPQPGEYIAFSEHDGEASFFTFLRGVRVIRENNKDTTQPPASATLDTGQAAPERQFMENDIPESSQFSAASYGGHFKRLRNLALAYPNDPLSSASRDAPIYHSALDELEPFFKEIYDLPASLPQSRAVDAHSRLAFGWLYRVSGGFINRLQGKTPLALAIFACFAVVLKRLETGWVVQGWPEHIMSGVWKFLRTESKDLVRWPMEQMGWRPSEGHALTP
ncbi:hypothetical protein DL98DRAFT_521511 [Cadophora sp. DSE1049]|nr:hypothetical protein DL98DRAFT_521511 [Cadophora sp. DSE1049]